jgi:hypothetical protein
MNTKQRYTLIFALALLGGAALVAVTWAAPGNAPLAQGGVPAVVSYQGEVRVSGDPYTGNGYFKFAVVNAAGNAAYWSNDGTSTGGGEPTAAVQLAVSDGLFSVLLGDTTLGGMTQALTADVFSQPNRYLRVWFSSDNVTFNQLAPDTRISAAPYALQAQEAADADTVDGLHASELGTHYQNVVVVAKSGGDYTSVQAAIDSIADAAADNAYLVWVAPGVYEEEVTMKPYVHLQGAGQGATVITSDASSSAWPPTQATLKLASDVSLRDLTVRNDGAGANSAAVLATAGVTRTLVADVTAHTQGNRARNAAVFLSGSGTGVTLQQVTGLAENATNINIGLWNRDGAAATLDGGSFTAHGGDFASGIDNAASDTTLEAQDVTALGEGGDINNGLRNAPFAAAMLRGGSFTGSGGTEARGIFVLGEDAMLVAQGVTALGEDGGTSYGLGTINGSAATLLGGSFTARGGGDARGIYSSGSDTTLEAQGVTALAENGLSLDCGLLNEGGAAATLHGGSFIGRGGIDTRAIRNYGSGTTLEAENITALSESVNTTSIGLDNRDGAEATLRGGSFTGRGVALYAYGIYNDGSNTTLEAESVIALAENGSQGNFGLMNYSSAEATLREASLTGRGGITDRGIYSYNNATADVTQSVLEGETNSVHKGSGAVTVSNSRLVGGTVGGAVNCVAVSYGATFYPGTCP